MEKKNSNMAKKEARLLEQNQEVDNHQHIMHSQVKKIKEEESERNVIDWPVLAREVIMTRQHSRSRLGLISNQSISVGEMLSSFTPVSNKMPSNSTKAIILLLLLDHVRLCLCSSSENRSTEQGDNITRNAE
ncbi:hypothetical protein HAX54_024334 [Datura stramonium]|uniref:Uncharacterized protein n=1 Tax=Datura stramonium TaxID=4076 RepID=A0ABS8S5W9_DATST|nr:hypothetical protein [Datura stramonium]